MVPLHSPSPTHTDPNKYNIPGFLWYFQYSPTDSLTWHLANTWQWSPQPAYAVGFLSKRFFRQHTLTISSVSECLRFLSGDTQTISSNWIQQKPPVFSRCSPHIDVWTAPLTGATFFGFVQAWQDEKLSNSGEHWCRAWVGNLSHGGLIWVQAFGMTFLSANYKRLVPWL